MGSVLFLDDFVVEVAVSGLIPDTPGGLGGGGDESDDSKFHFKK